MTEMYFMSRLYTPPTRSIALVKPCRDAGPKLVEISVRRDDLRKKDVANIAVGHELH